MVQAGVYSATLHYLKAAAEMGTAEAKKDGAATVARMKAMPTEDDCFGAGPIRQDGRVIHPSLSVGGEDTVRQQGCLGLLQAARHHAGRPGVPPAGGWQVLARQPERTAPMINAGPCSAATAAAAARLGWPPRPCAGRRRSRSACSATSRASYRDLSRPGRVACARQAIEDMAPQLNGIAVEVVRRRPPEQAGYRRRDRAASGSIGMAWIWSPTAELRGGAGGVRGRGKEQGALNSPAMVADLTGPQCAPTTVHWTMDTWALAHSTGGALVKAGGDILVLHHRRLRLRPGAGARHDGVRQAGGRQRGGLGRRFRFPTTDFSSLLLQAQACGAKVIGLCNAGPTR